MTAVRITLGTELSKPNAVRLAGVVVAGLVRVEYFNTDKELDVITALEKLIELVREDFHDAP